MAVSYQLVIDCTSPEPLAHFWAEALHYVIEPPPSGFDSWDEFYRSIGVPEDELGIGADSIADPNGEGPRIWFQVVPEQKSIKNRLHIDLHASGGRDTPLDDPARAGRGGGGAARGPRCDAAARDRRGGSRPLRGRDDRSRRKRVRHQLGGMRGPVGAGSRSEKSWKSEPRSR